MRNQPFTEPSDELKEIYRQLKLGVAHERVNDENVETLIDMAARNGDTELETLLREWAAPCDDGDDTPSVIAPTPGFNKTNVKH
ncbi:MAG TPA: hypothetical protein VKZ48_01490 [Burkholderiales bacterium]|nr:hypothetical protein [Burkholderiales bacterium]